MIFIKYFFPITYFICQSKIKNIIYPYLTASDPENILALKIKSYIDYSYLISWGLYYLQWLINYSLIIPNYVFIVFSNSGSYSSFKPV